ncbi:MAG: sugar ABC transporter substrate-binding protein [Actinobacteria bacterium]|nr:sugar ABC transporter substrate-binding protein [Actinomycetota bacterium]
MVFLALAVAACGGGSSSSTETTTEAASSSAEGAAATGGAEGTEKAKPAAAGAGGEYKGPQKSLPASFGEPKKSGKPMTFGYLQIYGSLPVLATEQRGAEEEAAKLGVKLIVKDAQLNPQTQVSQFNQLLAQGVEGIVVYPVVAGSLGPSLEQAKAAGIPVVSTNARPDVTKPLPPGYTADVEQTLDVEAYEMARVMSESKPGAKFGIIGLGLPVEALKYLAARQQYWGEHFGLKYVGTVDAKQDTPTAYGPAASELLAKAPEIEQIFTYNDAVALTASTVARSSGKSEIEIAGGSGTEEAAMKAIQAGQITMSYQMPWAETGAEMIKGAYDYATKQHVPLPETVGLRGTVITKENAGEVEPTK